MTNTMTTAQAQQILSLTPKWEKFKHSRTISFETHEMDFIGKIYKELFGAKLDMGCTRCMIDGVTSLMIHAEAQRESIEALELAQIATDEVNEPQDDKKPNKRNRK